MARTSTLLQLRADVRSKSDTEGDPHVTDAEIDRAINQSAARLFAEIVQHGEDDYVASHTFSTVAGTEKYALPAAFYKLVGAMVTIGNGEVRDMNRWTWNERALYLSTHASWLSQAQPLAYRLVGSDLIWLLPTPDGVYSVTLHYVAAPAPMVLTTDTFDGRAGWEEWIALDAAIKIKLKSEEDVSALMQLRTAEMASIAPQAATKDAAKPDRVQDVRGRRDPWCA